MQLTKHIAQGKLQYLSQGDEAISVSENEHFRWLAFTNRNADPVIQSVMHKRKPWQLTLPHQTALLLPLLFFRPVNIIELGLGGGNLDRFLCHLSSDINMRSIEQSETVITCFKRYFNPENATIEILNNKEETWFSLAKDTNPCWLICDIYQSKQQNMAQVNNQLTDLIDTIDHDSCLSINLPDASDDDVNLCLTVLQQLQGDHDIYYFHIPNYLNIVIQLIPKHWQINKLLKRNNNTYLPRRLFLQWRKFWLQGNEVMSNTRFQ